MARQVDFTCSTHVDPWECPDKLIHYLPKFDEYGIIIHDGGESVSTIQFCPWCGSQLPQSKRDRWFRELETLGIKDPSDDNIPDDYRTAAWHTRSR